MKYAKQTQTGFQIGLITELFPNTSFPEGGPPASFLEQNNICEVVESLAYNEKTHKVEASAPFLVNGKVYVVEIVALSASEAAQKASETQALLATEIRNTRTALLAASDWTQVADSPVNKAAWAVYRQALRDVSSQSSFPNEVVWPTAPV